MVSTQLTLPPFYSPLKTHSHTHIHSRVAEAPTTCSSTVISTQTHSDEWIYIVKQPTGDIWGLVSCPGTLQHVDCGGRGWNRTLWLGWAVAHLMSFSPNQKTFTSINYPVSPNYSSWCFMSCSSFPFCSLRTYSAETVIQGETSLWSATRAARHWAVNHIIIVFLPIIYYHHYY